MQVGATHVLQENMMQLEQVVRMENLVLTGFKSADRRDRVHS